MSVLAGALTAADVVDVPDDAAALRAAARQFSDAADGVLAAATSGSRTWSALPSVFTADALTPALAPLMDPAVGHARQLQGAADEFLRVAGRAADRIEDLHHDHDSLVAQIDRFHASAPGRVAAHAAQQASSGDLLGAVATVVTNWRQVPALVTEEAALRVRVLGHNDAVTSTLAGIAAQLDAITPAAAADGTVHLASAVHHDDGNWFSHAWHDVETVTKVAWTGVEVGAEAAWPYVQDGAAMAGNVFASLGNAMVNHPDEVLTLLGGLALMAGGGAMEGGGVVLDITGVGAIVGVPLNISGAAVIAAGGTMAVAGGVPLGLHAMTDDSESPFDTDHAERWKKEQNEQHPGRNKDGTYRSEGNQEAHADVKAKEQQGVAEVADDAGLPYTTQQVKATVDGAPNGRFFDGLMEKPDGTYAGIEVKSGGASRSADQRVFDGLVSPDNPAFATLDGKVVKITSVILKKVP